MMNKKISVRTIAVLLMMIMLCAALTFPAMAADTQTADAPAETTEAAEDSMIGSKAIAAAIAIGLAAAAGAIGMSQVGCKSAEAIARQPEAEGKIRTSSMLTLVFIETAVIYALLTVILIIFVL